MDLFRDIDKLLMPTHEYFDHIFETVFYIKPSIFTAYLMSRKR